MSKTYKKHLKQLSSLNKYDCWNIDEEFCHWIVPRLKRLKKYKAGTPCIICSLMPNDDVGSQKTWKWILNTKILGFKLYIDADLQNELSKETELAMRLFAKYWIYLWT